MTDSNHWTLPSAQMITSAIAVNTNGATVLSNGATYGILLAILFAHGIVCSAATRILARINILYVIINGELMLCARGPSDPSFHRSGYNHCGYHYVTCLLGRQ
jgi:hypothetical protein